MMIKGSDSLFLRFTKNSNEIPHRFQFQNSQAFKSNPPVVPTEQNPPDETKVPMANIQLKAAIG